LLGIAVHLFDMNVAMVDADGEVTFVGEPADTTDPAGSAPPVLLVPDGDGHLVGHPDEPPKNDRT